MAPIKSSREIEIKLRVPDISALRLRLRQLRALEISPRTHEFNTLYDTKTKDLTRRGRLIRLRIEQREPRGTHRPKGKDSTAILTFKGPSQKSSSKTAAKAANRPFKIREEVEVTLDSGEQMSVILRALKLNPVFQYEKFRTTYALPGIPKVKVELDETPVGVFLELEGTIPAIERAARRLGYPRSEYITQTYGALYIADCRRRGVRPANMLFQPTKKLR